MPHTKAQHVCLPSSNALTHNNRAQKFRVAGGNSAVFSEDVAYPVQLVLPLRGDREICFFVLAQKLHESDRTDGGEQAEPISGVLLREHNHAQSRFDTLDRLDRFASR